MQNAPILGSWRPSFDDLRGYENFDAKLRGLGANVERLPGSELPNFLQVES